MATTSTPTPTIAQLIAPTELESASVSDGQRMVTRTRLGNEVVYALWERTESIDSHLVFRVVDGAAWGEVGTRALPGWVTRMTPVEVRRTAALAFREDQCVEAHAAIVAAYPEASSGYSQPTRPYELRRSSRLA